MAQAMRIHELAEGWSFRQTDAENDEWLSVRRVPTNVHLDLLDHKKIADPFLGFNELAAAWVGETSWTYRVQLPTVGSTPTAIANRNHDKGASSSSSSSSSISSTLPPIRHVLAFDGLDTFATATLGGARILESDNMWLMHRVDVTDALQQTQSPQQPSHQGQEQQQQQQLWLEIEFKSALAEARRIKAAHPEHAWVGFNGDPARLAVRKAQYHWGWDWGPELAPCGPWRAVRLESYCVRVAELRVDYEVGERLGYVQGVVWASVEGVFGLKEDEKQKDGEGKGVGGGGGGAAAASTAATTAAATAVAAMGLEVEFCASLEGKEVFRATAPVEVANNDDDNSSSSSSNGSAQVEFRINEPRLWYPHGYGQQPLYSVTATVVAAGAGATAAANANANASSPATNNSSSKNNDNNNNNNPNTNGRQPLHSLTKRTAFRRAELVQEADEIGRSFYFRLNGVDVFCGGSNWIPADSFTPRIAADTYRRWVQTAVDGGQVMLRVWGGGTWEADVFYELCDELGVLVWHDFMFACGNYPCFPHMLQSIEAEAVGQVKRLRHHPCIVIYAGNNEDYQVQEQSGLTYDYEDKDPQSWLRTNFPARYIYEKLLPDVVATHAPQVAYHPGSPWGDGKPTSDATVGDLHQWNVWHGTQEKYQVFPQLGGRFNSEFGMEAFPHIDTIRWFVTDSGQLFPQSAMMDFHNKAAGHERRIATYVVENFRMCTGLEQFAHLTQLSQAEALLFAYRGWRRQWGQGRRCGGALVWQLNDCWPGTSWAIVDYFQRKKPAYYALRRALAPVAVGVQRAHHDWSVVHATPATSSAWTCWVVSSRPTPVTATVELRFISIASGHEIKGSAVRRHVQMAANGTTDVLSGTIDHTKEEPHVLAARVWVAGQLVSRDVDWPQPLKYLDFSERGVEVVTSRHGDSIEVRARRPTKGVVFEERTGVLLGDSALDVVPGDVQVVSVRGLGPDDDPLRWTYLGAP